MENKMVVLNLMVIGAEASLKIKMTSKRIKYNIVRLSFNHYFFFKHLILGWQQFREHQNRSETFCFIQKIATLKLVIVGTLTSNYCGIPS